MNFEVTVHLHQTIPMLKKKETKKVIKKEVFNYAGILNLSIQYSEDVMGNVIFPTERTFLKM